MYLHTADLDTSPKKRQETPDFYGLIPPTGRGVIFVLMMVNSTSQFLAKIMAIALLGAVNKTWAFGYLAGDFGLFLIYILLRNDFFYFISMPSYTVSIVHGMLSRAVMKVREKEGGSSDNLSCNLVNPCFILIKRLSVTSQLCYN